MTKREPINLESLRVIGEKFREWEAPFKEAGDWRGLWLGASALVIEGAVEELAECRRRASGEDAQEEQK